MGTVGATLVHPARQHHPRYGRLASGLWFPVLAFFAVRAFDVVAIVVGSWSQRPLSAREYVARVGSDPNYLIYQDSPRNPGYWTVVTNWDGQWYWKIAAEGLHSGTSSSPLDLWAWAFGPAFPLTVRTVMHTTGLSFAVSATLVNLACALIGVLLLWDLLRRTAGTFWAACAVALFLCFPSGVLFQAAYSEALAFALVMATLWLLHRRCYWWALAPLALLAFTRIVTPPMALVPAAQLFLMWRQRHQHPLRLRWVLGAIAVGLTSVAGVYFWGLAGGLIGGPKTGAGSRVVVTGPRESWLLGVHSPSGWLGPVLGLAMVGLLVAAAAAPMARPFGLELRSWLAAYPLFVLLVTPPTTGIIRYLVLCPPIAFLFLGVVGRGRRWRLASATVVGCVGWLSLQWWYATHALAVATHGAVMP